MQNSNVVNDSWNLPPSSQSCVCFYYPLPTERTRTWHSEDVLPTRSNLPWAKKSCRHLHFVCSTPANLPGPDKSSTANKISAVGFTRSARSIERSHATKKSKRRSLCLALPQLAWRAADRCDRLRTASSFRFRSR